MNMKNADFWDVATCRSWVTRLFGGMYRLSSFYSYFAHAGSSLADFSTLKMETICFTESQFTQDLHGTTSQKTAFFNKYYSYGCTKLLCEK
jgi:hypothetical protein